MSNANPEDIVGAITGTVKDQDGEGLPGVVVQVESPDLNDERIAVSRANGDFLFRLLPPGNYTLTATMTGFNTYRRSDIVVGIGKTVNVAVVMTPQTMREG